MSASGMLTARIPSVDGVAERTDLIAGLGSFSLGSLEWMSLSVDSSSGDAMTDGAFGLTNLLMSHESHLEDTGNHVSQNSAKSREPHPSGGKSRQIAKTLKNGKAIRVGCALRKKHGHTSKGHCRRTYDSWRAMNQRCTNPRSSNWADYGGRGIKVDPRWLASYLAFLADMGPRPEGMTLDRENVNLGYNKTNCRWATKSEQQRNRRCCK